ncbi:uncharacterized protein V6R79_004518 [Siganus canaliculatus]
MTLIGDVWYDSVTVEDPFKDIIILLHSSALLCTKMVVWLLLQFAALLLCAAESSTTKVQQTPRAVFKAAGEKVQIHCNHSDTDLIMILWYKQSRQTHDMTLIGYVRWNSVTVENPFNDTYAVSGSGTSSSSLHIMSRERDSTWYFCVASYAH